MIYTHQAQYYETDQMGIIHHSNYIRWMGEARIAYMDEMGFPYRAVEEAGIISPVLSVQCEYRAMTRFGDRICIEVSLRSFKGVKYEIAYVMRDEKTQEVRAVAASRHCYLTKDGKPVNIKRALPALYGKMMSALETAPQPEQPGQRLTGRRKACPE